MKLKNTKGFIFDLDGVIVDTAKYHFLAWRNLANSIDVDFTEIQNEQLKGISRKKSLERILEWGNVSLEEDAFLDLMGKKNEDYLSHVEKMDETEILPNVAEVLNYLKQNNQPMALGSASRNAKSILKRVGLLEKFDAIVDGNDTTKGKPNPEVFLKAAERLGVEPKNCIVFEDALAGIKAANTAGMISIGIGDQNVLIDADYCFRDFTEFNTDFLDTLIESENK